MNDPCPTLNCTGTLTTYTSKQLSTGSLKRRRKCSCCGRVEVAIVRPAIVIAVRVVHEGCSIKNTTRKSNTPKPLE